jgi:ADP-heptose:LPS heptosyltransferase
MNIDTMRWIDRHVGAPACAIATPLVRFWHWAFRLRQPRSSSRLLFIELSEMGSTILAEPAMRKVSSRIGAELYFVIFKRNVGSLKLTETIPSANIFTISEETPFHLVRDTLAFLIWTRRKGIDTVIDLELFSRFTALLAGFSGASRRVGFYRFHNEGLYRGEMLTHRVAFNPHIHIAKNFVALVDAVLAGAPTVPYSKTLIGDEQIQPPVIRPLAASRAAMLARICEQTGFDPDRQRLVLINPNASELLPHRRWMPDRFAELIRLILAGNADVIVAITGAPEEQAEAETLAAACGPRCFSFAGKTSLADLPALYSLAAAMVSNDSGPAHFASAAQLPTIVLFGPETPKLYQPLGTSQAIYAGLACSPCVSAHNHRKTACTDNVCMQAIDVDRVHGALESLLGQCDRPVSAPVS